MLRAKLEKPKKSQLTMLCLGAHSDDIEIGCGGSVIKWIDEHPEVQVHWVVLSASQGRENEAQTSAELFLEKAKSKNVVVKDFRDSFFPYIGGDIKKYFEELKKAVISFSHTTGMTFTKTTD
jgi:LmbE family N-acetylglucosaminyl deacetylase